MAKIFVISDTHFRHENIYKFLSYDGVSRVRPQFSSAKEADEYMIDMWNQTVGVSDHIYHLGDFSISPSGIGIAKLLNGHKRLVLGNHDHFDPRRYWDAGFRKIFGIKQHSGVWLTHAPIHWGDEHAEDRKGKFIGNVHGHIHERYSPSKRHFNACVEWTSYKPIELEYAIETFRKRFPA